MHWVAPFSKFCSLAPTAEFLCKNNPFRQFYGFLVMFFNFESFLKYSAVLLSLSGHEYRLNKFQQSEYVYDGKIILWCGFGDKVLHATLSSKSIEVEFEISSLEKFRLQNIFRAFNKSTNSEAPKQHHVSTKIIYRALSLIKFGQFCKNRS